MNHISVGKERTKSKTAEPSREREVSKFSEDAVTAIGLCAVCLMLLLYLGAYLVLRRKY